MWQCANAFALGKISRCKVVCRVVFLILANGFHQNSFIIDSLNMHGLNFLLFLTAMNFT